MFGALMTDYQFIWICSLLYPKPFKSQIELWYVIGLNPEYLKGWTNYSMWCGSLDYWVKPIWALSDHNNVVHSCCNRSMYLFVGWGRWPDRKSKHSDQGWWSMSFFFSWLHVMAKKKIWNSNSRAPFLVLNYTWLFEELDFLSLSILISLFTSLTIICQQWLTVKKKKKMYKSWCLDCLKFLSSLYSKGQVIFKWFKLNSNDLFKCSECSEAVQ